VATVRATEPVLTTRALNRAALGRQLLLKRATLPPVAAIERLGGMQAQLARPPFIGLWTRLADFSRADLIRAIARGDVVRGTTLRGTIHLMSRRDFLMVRPAVQPVLSKAMTRVFGRSLGTMDVDGFLAAARSCFEATPCTFAKLRDHLRARFPSLDERAMGYVVRMQLPLIQLPRDGEPWGYPSAADFTVADTYLGETIGRETPAHSLALRYFEAFGPASIQDFQTWSGLSAARPVIDAIRPKLVMVRDEHGRELFDVPKGVRDNADATAPVRFLPDYDNLLLAYADRTRIIDDTHKKLLATKNLVVPATFLVDGRVAGMWKIEMKKKDARLLLTPFAALKKPVRQALEEEGEQLLRFVEPGAGRYSVAVAS
jgi:hypothetical protein